MNVTFPIAAALMAAHTERSRNGHVVRRAQSGSATASFSVHQHLAIHCASGGCISSGPNCDTSFLPGQCYYPAAREHCIQHPTCVGVTCNDTSEFCRVRSVTALTLWEGWSSAMVNR